MHPEDITTINIYEPEKRAPKIPEGQINKTE